jgi:hypothetical protein
MAWRLRAGIALASAAGLAAMIAVSLLRSPLSPEDALTEMPVAEATPTDLRVPGLPEMPQLADALDGDLVEESFALPGLPAFPSIDDALSAGEGASDEDAEEAL